ncbi:MAG: hypothetical protein JWR04_1732 [Rhodoglobus sp.]|nr:hypothetical protein [Rhodoglobus sp.]
MTPMRNQPGTGRRRAVVARPATRRSRGFIALALAVIAASVISPMVAFGAVPGGPATVSTTVNFVSGIDLTTPITELSANYAAPVAERRYALQVGYSCGAAAACTDTTITIDPQPLDSSYGTQRFATYDSSTLPAGATISGTPASGYVVRLGTLATGASGSFTVLYSFQDRRNGVASAESFFLDGTTITNRVTIDAANAGATASATDSVVWHIATPAAPLVSFVTTSLARANTDYSYVVRMASDCMWYYSTANYGEPSKLCAAEYSNTLTLPTGVTFVSASPDGNYNAGSNTVTWAQSGEAAATGWGSINGRGLDRTVTVRFPDAMFPSACTIGVSATFATRVTYLDGQEKDATTTTSHQATNCAPFASATPVTKTTTTQQTPNIVWDSVENYFSIGVGNKANVPGVAVIRDDNLGAIANVRVYRVTATGSTIEYALDDGTTGTTTTSPYNAPAGRKIVSVVITSPSLIGPNQQVGSQPNTTFYGVQLRYTVDGPAPSAGWQRSNTATAEMTYPGWGLPAADEGSATANFTISPTPGTFTAGISRVVPGGANPTAGQPVNYTVTGRTSEILPGALIEPQYLFVAPSQWNITAGSWALAAGAPAGAIFDTKTVTIAGQARQALYVHWPAGTTWGANANWPNLTVTATPSTSATAGSSGIASSFIGDAAHALPGLAGRWNPTTFPDAPDLDGDGSTTENFATVSAAGVTVGAASALSTVKEICRVNPAAAGGCDWVSDASQTIPVSPVASDIRYRVTITNNGNTALPNVVAYDVLPYPGDTGVSSGSASTPRGSQFTETVAIVSNVSSNLALAYSTSTNPCRTQVYAGGPAGCANTWSTTAASAASVRATVNGSLAPGASASFGYTASVLGTPAAGQRACNSIATAATGLPVSEPSPVCASIEAADLEVTASAPTDVQIGRPTVLPFTVANLSGTDAPAKATVTIPSGVRITDLDFDSWSCTAGGATAPVTGPVTLICELPAPLGSGDTAAMNIPAVVLANGVAITTTAGSAVYDPDPTNNTDAITITADPAAAGGLTITKTDGVTALVAGQQATYTITVANQLTGESVDSVAIADILPLGLDFVSASDSGTFDIGTRTITWPVVTLTAAGSAQRTVTAVLAAGTTGTVSNVVSASAPDPAFPADTLSASATDVDQIDAIVLTKSATMDAPGDPFDPHVGDTLRYEFAVANTGAGTLTGVNLADPKSGLSAITFPGGWPGATGVLGAGESVTGIATYALTQDDIDNGSTSNTATVTAASIGGGTVTGSSTVNYPIPAVGGITLDKLADLDLSGPVVAGDQIEYTFTSQNTGNVTLHDVEITDALAGLSALTYTWPDMAAPGILEPGETVTATATYTLSQSDLDRGSVANSATVSALDTLDAPLDAADGVVTGIPAAPAVAFDKVGALLGGVARPAAGDVVEFGFELQNTGNVTVSGLAITDALAGVSVIAYDPWPAAAGTLAPGQSVTGTATYTLSQADVDAGAIINTASLTGVPARGTAIDEDATATVPLAQVPGLSVVKTAVLTDTNGDGAANPGEQIQYTFALENTGNVTLVNVRVNDGKVTGVAVTASMAPGQTAMVTADPYTVTTLDALFGRVDNTATASGTAPNSSATTSGPSSTTTPAGSLPSDPLAFTGQQVNIALVVAGGGGLVLAGLVLLLIRRRQRSARR